MHAEAEGEVAPGVPAHVQAVRPGPGGRAEQRLVPVGGREHADQGVAGPDQRAVDLDVLGRHPGQSEMDDREVAQQLLDARAQGVRAGGQQRPLVGAAQQGQRGERGHVRGALVAGDQEQEAHGRGLLKRQVLAAGKPAEDVVTGAAPLVRGEFGQVRHEFAVGGGGLLGRGGVVEQGPAERLEEVVVPVGHAEQQADHQRGYGEREVGHQVGASAVPGHPVDRPVHDLLDLRAQRVDPLHQ